MSILTRILDALRSLVRTGARTLARGLNTLSGGKLSPDVITIVSLLGHIPVALLIATLHPRWAALFLVIFGLMDTLDGELARLQNRASSAGMLLDASTDRIKESMLYIACAYALIGLGHPYMSVWAVAACAGALLVSYVKAKGETAVASSNNNHHATNHLFDDGLMRYEVRMFVLVIGLLSGYLGYALIILTILAWLTAFGRLIRVLRHLSHVQN
jgi:CDP-diacylglycerol--glycerol-3-phosphate 3-phosphatidyltransferase